MNPETTKLLFSATNFKIENTGLEYFFFANE